MDFLCRERGDETDPLRLQTQLSVDLTPSGSILKLPCDGDLLPLLTRPGNGEARLHFAGASNAALNFSKST